MARGDEPLGFVSASGQQIAARIVKSQLLLVSFDLLFNRSLLGHEQRPACLSQLGSGAGDRGGRQVGGHFLKACFGVAHQVRDYGLSLEPGFGFVIKFLRLFLAALLVGFSL